MPSVFVGDQEQLSGGCFNQDIQRGETTGLNNLVEEALREREFEADLKTKFIQSLGDVSLQASAHQALMNTWRTEIKGIKVIQIDPANA